MSSDKIKSSPNNRISAIIEALKAASEIAETHCDHPLGRMPEYFMAMKVAEYFSKNFLNFGYRLEASVKQTLEDAGIAKEEITRMLKEEPYLRGNGRFDLVLRTAKRGMPAHVIEFKRGSRSARLAKDLIRLAYMSKAVSQGAKLETNYLVFTTKKSEEDLEAILYGQMAELRSDCSAKAGRVFYKLKRYENIGYWKKDDTDKKPAKMAIAVFEVQYNNRS